MLNAILFDSDLHAHKMCDTMIVGTCGSTCSGVCLWRHLQVDFWSPESAETVTIDIDVDIHVPAMYLDMVYTLLHQSDMEHE